MTGKDIWDNAVIQGRNQKSTNLVRIYALVQMIAEVQSAIVHDDRQMAVHHLREAQAYSERMVGLLLPAQQRALRLINPA
jgi:hypothetical protein